jgi:hypothetical protein
MRSPAGKEPEGCFSGCGGALTRHNRRSGHTELTLHGLCAFPGHW